MNLNFIADKAHQFEDAVSELLEKEELSGHDFLGLVLKLNQFQETMKEVKSVIRKLAQFHGSEVRNKKVDLTISSLEKTISKLSKEQGKSVDFDYSKFKQSDIPDKYRKISKDIMVQLVRNSIGHGIETVEDRVSLGKDGTGEVILETRLEQGKVIIDFRDDGRGLQLEKIKAKAKESGNFTDDELASMTTAEVAQLIFNSGLSTAESMTMTAGRGVGMDIIQQQVKKQGGNISISFKKDEFCRFQVSLPLANSV